jgi:hypothetical protein
MITKCYVIDFFPIRDGQKIPSSCDAGEVFFDSSLSKVTLFMSLKKFEKVLDIPFEG